MKQKINWKLFSNSIGYKSLKKAVLYDCQARCDKNCFNIMGCHERKIKHKCFHRYCDTFKWIIDKVKHYNHKTGISVVDILDIWEEKRNYWYMNYYQDCNLLRLGKYLSEKP